MNNPKEPQKIGKKPFNFTTCRLHSSATVAEPKKYCRIEQRIAWSSINRSSTYHFQFCRDTVSTFDFHMWIHNGAVQSCSMPSCSKEFTGLVRSVIQVLSQTPEATIFASSTWEKRHPRALLISSPFSPISASEQWCERTRWTMFSRFLSLRGLQKCMECKTDHHRRRLIKQNSPFGWLPGNKMVLNKMYQKIGCMYKCKRHRTDLPSDCCYHLGKNPITKKRNTENKYVKLACLGTCCSFKAAAAEQPWRKWKEVKRVSWCSGKLIDESARSVFCETTSLRIFKWCISCAPAIAHHVLSC